MPENGLLKRVRPAVVQEAGQWIDDLGQADPPQRPGLSLTAICREVDAMICQPLPHVV